MWILPNELESRSMDDAPRKRSKHSRASYRYDYDLTTRFFSTTFFDEQTTDSTTVESNTLQAQAQEYFNESALAYYFEVTLSTSTIS